MKSLLTLLAISFLGANSTNALTGMEIFNLCKNEGVEEACKHKTLQNEINEAKSNCKATFSMPSSKRAACEKLKELEKEFKKDLPKNIPYVFISAQTGKGLVQLKDILWKELNNE